MSRNIPLNHQAQSVKTGVKVAGLHSLRFEGPALCFDSGQEAYTAVDARGYKEDDVIIILYEGPKSGPGMREMLSATGAIDGQGADEKVALITDGRFSCASRTDYNSGAIWKYVQLIGLAYLGATTHPGSEAEGYCYADI